MGCYRRVSFFTKSSLCDRCHQMDDFSPAKNLMTMCFTYYYVGKRHLHPWALLVLVVKCALCMGRVMEGTQAWLILS